MPKFYIKKKLRREKREGFLSGGGGEDTEGIYIKTPFFSPAQPAEERKRALGKPAKDIVKGVPIRGRKKRGKNKAVEAILVRSMEGGATAPIVNKGAERILNGRKNFTLALTEKRGEGGGRGKSKVKKGKISTTINAHTTPLKPFRGRKWENLREGGKRGRGLPGREGREKEGGKVFTLGRTSNALSSSRGKTAIPVKRGEREADILKNFTKTIIVVGKKKDRAPKGSDCLRYEKKSPRKGGRFR